MKHILLFLLFPAFYSGNLFAETEPDNNSWEGADIIDENSSVGAFLEEGASDFFYLTTSEDGNIYVYYETESTDFAAVYVWDVDAETQLAYGELVGYGTLVIEANGLAAGGYYIQVVGLVDEGEYTLSNSVNICDLPVDEEYNDIPDEAIIFYSDTDVYGHIGYRWNGGDRDSVDYYAISLEADGNLNLHLQGGGNYTYINILDDDGETVLAGDGGWINYGPYTATANYLAAGNYFARVYADPGSFGCYTLYWWVDTCGINDTEPNDTPETAMPILLDEIKYGHTGFRYNGGTFDTYDYYIVETTEDGNLSATLEGGGGYSYVTIYDIDGTTVLASDGGWINYGPYTTVKNGLASGTYVIGINTTSIQAGCYSVTVHLETCGESDEEINDEIDYAIPIFEGDSIAGHIGYRKNAGDYDAIDYYVINLEMDGNITANLFGGAGYTYITIYDIDGSTVLASSGGWIDYGPYSATKNGLSAGTYYLGVTRGELSFGCYGISITNTSCGPADAELNDSYTEATELELYANMEGTIGYYRNGGTSDEYDYYTISLAESGEFSATITSSALYHYIEFLDSDGSTVLSSSGGWFEYGPYTVTLPGITAGTYYIRISSPSFFGCYDLSSAFCPSEISIISSGGNILCEGASTWLSTPGIYEGYQWSTGETTSQILVNTAGDYTLTINNSDGCTVLSDIITIEEAENPIPVISAAGPVAFCEGESVLLEAGTFYTYQWYLNGLILPGATTASYIAENSGEYQVEVTDVNNCIGLSDVLELTVLDYPETPVIIQDGNILSTSSPYVLQWYKDGSPIPGANSSVYTVSSDGVYSVSAENSGCISYSDALEIVYQSLQALNVSPVIIAPNPNTGSFQLLNIYGVGTLEIRNVTGELVYSQNRFWQKNELVNLQLPEGVFSIRFINENNSIQSTQLIVIH